MFRFNFIIWQAISIDMKSCVISNSLDGIIKLSPLHSLPFQNSSTIRLWLFALWIFGRCICYIWTDIYALGCWCQNSVAFKRLKAIQETEKKKKRTSFWGVCIMHLIGLCDTIYVTQTSLSKVFGSLRSGLQRNIWCFLRFINCSWQLMFDKKEKNCVKGIGLVIDVRLYDRRAFYKENKNLFMLCKW